MDAKTQQSLSFLFGRRSVRAYKPGPVPDDMVRTLLEAAMERLGQFLANWPR